MMERMIYLHNILINNLKTHFKLKLLREEGSKKIVERDLFFWNDSNIPISLHEFNG